MYPIMSASIVEDNARKEEQSQEDEEKQQHCAREGERSLTMSLHQEVHSPPSSHHPQPLWNHLHSPLLDHTSSPISAQIFNFCHPDIFQDALQNSEVTSNPNCCVYEDQNSSFATNISFASSMADYKNDDNTNELVKESLDITNFQGDQNKYNTNTNTSTTTSSTPTTTTISATSTHHQSGPLLFNSQDEIDNDISINFSPSATPYTLTDLTQLPLTTDHHHVNILNFGLLPYPTNATPMGPTVLPPYPTTDPLGSVFKDDCLSPIPPFLRLNLPPPTTATGSSSSSSSSFLDPFLPENPNHGLGSDNSGLFTGGNLLMPSDLQGKELDFRGDNGGIFCPEQLPRVYNSGDIQQAFSHESSQLVSAATSSASAPLTTEISSLSEDSSFKVGKLSVEQRKEKIHRYMKKRNERNFSKKIKYACRKTLADSRPRVRGRFAKNDDFGDATHSHINGHLHDEDDYDEYQQEHVKEEDDLVDSSDIFSHINGVNSFKCNYQIQSWI